MDAAASSAARADALERLRAFNALPWRYRALLGEAPAESPFAGVQAALADALISGGMFGVCPCCGRELRSAVSIPLFTEEWIQPVLYEFDCCARFYLIYGFSPFQLLALYTPDDDRIELLFDGDIYPQDFFLSYLRRNVEELAEVERDYGPALERLRRLPVKKTVVAQAFVRNMGHHVREDLMGLYAVDRDWPEGAPPPAALLGPFDHFDAAAGLTRLAVAGRITRKDRDGQRADALRMTLDGGWFVLRIGCFGPTSGDLLRAVVARAAERTPPDRLAAMQAFARRPLIFLTVRSHSRRWVSQEDGLVSLIRGVLAEHPQAGFIFDGWTQERPLVDAIFRKLAAEGVDPAVHCRDGLAISLWETLLWAKESAVFVSPFGDSSFFFYTSNKPGIYYGCAPFLWSRPFSLIRRDDGCVRSIPVSGRPVTSGRGEEYDQAAYLADFELDVDELRRTTLGLLAQVLSDDPPRPVHDKLTWVDDPRSGTGKADPERFYE